MDIPATTDSQETVESLRRTIEEFQRRFRLLDEQMRILERERQKLSAVVHHTDAGFLVVDSSLKVVWANGVFARRFVKSSHPGALLGERCNRVLCGRDEICEQCPAAQPFKFGDVAHHEICLEFHGRPRHLYATAMPIKSLAGDVDQTIVMLQDVSNLKVLRQSQEALKASEERFRSIFENAAAGVITVAPDGSFLQINPAFCRFLGYPEAELLKLRVLDVTHPDDREMGRKAFQEILSGSRKPVELEKRYLRKDGTTAWAHVAATWLFDAKGQPTYGVALVQDIGKRKKAEEALRQSEARKGAILNTAIDAIITIDHDGTVTEFNPAAERMFGYLRAEVQGRRMADLLVPPSLRERHNQALARYLLTGEGQVLGKRIELTALRKDGTEFPVEISINPIPLDGAPAFTGYVRDITERKRAEEMLRQREEQLRHSQKMEAVGTLAGGVAHDFNNILTGILGYAELLKMGSRPEEKVYKAAEVIEKGAMRAATLTQQLLGFARKGKHQNIRVDLHATIQEVAGLLGSTLDKSIGIRLELGSRTAWVQGDPGQMGQVMLNLAVNAADAMPGGGDLVFRTQEVALEEETSGLPLGAKPGRYLLIRVIDTGCGIPEEFRGRIFEPFFTTKEKGKGTGMGLAMVYGIVQNHGGFLEVESEVGRGTVFKIYLPLAVEREARVEPEATRKAREGGPSRILVVDDEEVVRCIAEEFLRQMGYEVVTATDGLEAVDAYRKSPEDFDLVIIDLVMPRLGGRECFRALREMNPHIRAILSTGYGFDREAQEILDEGMLGFVQKPYQMRQLAETVASALRS